MVILPRHLGHAPYLWPDTEDACTKIDGKKFVRLLIRSLITCGKKLVRGCSEYDDHVHIWLLPFMVDKGSGASCMHAPFGQR